MRERCSACAVRTATLWGDDAPFGGRPTRSDCLSYLISIGGGTDQIQRQHHRRAGARPARGTAADKDLAFSELKVGTQTSHSHDPRPNPSRRTAHRSEALENIVTMLRAQAAGAATPEITVEVAQA